VSAKYHPGEIEVQERAGVRSMAERVGNSIHPTIPPAAREFLEEQSLVVVGSVGADGRYLSERWLRYYCLRILENVSKGPSNTQRRAGWRASCKAYSLLRKAVCR
jgi:predicted pyridoxine 5'-phosphate oxidase superfamily flavin-nucleotide-binding protein